MYWIFLSTNIIAQCHITKCQKKLVCVYSSKLSSIATAPFADSVHKIYCWKAFYNSFGRMDLACLIPDHWEGEIMCFEDNYAHSDYKYHKHIDPSQNGPSHTPKDSESKTALNLP